MKKNILTFLIIIFSLFVIVGCENKKDNTTKKEKKGNKS